MYKYRLIGYHWKYHSSNGGFNHLEKKKVNGKDDIPHVKWTIKVMFQNHPQL